MEQRELTLAPESVGLRLDRWLAEQCPDLSRSQLQNLIEAGSVTCNGSPLNKKDKLKAGQTILLTLPDPQPIEAQPQNIPLDIVYEDDSPVYPRREQPRFAKNSLWMALSSPAA